MAQHVRMDVKRQTSPHPGNPDQVVDGRARKLIAALVEKEPGQLGIATLRQVAFKRPQFIGLERLLGRQAPFETLNPDTPVCEVDVLALEAAEFGDASPMIEGEHEHGRIAPSVARTRCPLEEHGKFLFAEIVPSALMRIHGRRLRRTFDITPHV